MFANTVPRTSAESEECIRMEVVAFTFPSFRSEDKWILEIFLVKVVCNWLYGYKCSFFNWHFQNVVIYRSISGKDAVSWSVVAGGFELYPVDVGELLQVLISDVCVCLDDFVHGCPQLLLDLRILAEIVDDHREVPRSRIRPSHQKC